jgi:hypothetical protein
MPSRKHEWKTVEVDYDGMYGPSGPSIVDWLYKLEGEGWEIVTVFNKYSDRPTILARRPFVPAVMREPE